MTANELKASAQPESQDPERDVLLEAIRLSYRRASGWDADMEDRGVTALVVKAIRTGVIQRGDQVKDLYDVFGVDVFRHIHGDIYLVPLDMRIEQLSPAQRDELVGCADWAKWHLVLEITDGIVADISLRYDTYMGICDAVVRQANKRAAERGQAEQIDVAD